MKILVIGLGSMGKRRVRLITQNYKEYKVIGVDARDDRREEAANLFGIQTYQDLGAALLSESPDASFISTSPASHPQLILKCLNENLHVFTEINLVNENHARLFEMSEMNHRELFVSSTPMFRKEINYIKSCIIENQSQGKCHYRYHVGQYLPDWHSWESYKDFFVAEKQTNGCREILAIELPWITKAFGKITNKIVLSDKISSLDLKYPDSYIIILEHETGHKGVLNIDIVSRKAVRNLEVFSEQVYLTWNGTPDGLYAYTPENKIVTQIDLYEKYESDNRYSDNIIEDAYLSEIELFFDRIASGSRPPLYTIKEEADILKEIDEIEGL